MSDSSDDDFEAYLARRRPIQKSLTSPDHLEPPAELDRIVIGKARQAIQPPPPLKVFRGLKWALPVALGVTLILLLTVALHLSARAPTVRIAESPAHALSAPAARLPAPAGPESAARSVANRGMARPQDLQTQRDPAAWLDTIRRLRAAGHTADAERELGRFREAYPNYPVPAIPPDGPTQ